MKKISRLFLILGLMCFCAGVYLIWERNNPSRLSIKNYKGNYKNIAVSNPPTRIIIDDLNIDLPIYPAKVNNDQWDTTTLGASYLITSPSPGEIGNSVIYAHDWASLFGPLLNARPGMQITVLNKDNTSRIFIVTSTRTVPYNYSQILLSTQDRRITLFTCTGFLDSQRFVVSATYKKDVKIAAKN